MTLLDLAGLVALLLWGVHMVQSGVLRALGPQLRSFLTRRLQNRFSAFGAGLAITALLQSSTATGLMATGFAADGLLTLGQGLAVMLGANVGTTLIVQLLSFDISLAAPILVLMGYLLFQRGRAGVRDFGRVFIGLGLVLFALHSILILLEPLTSNHATQMFLQGLSTHIVFIVLIGVALTWAVHSSVAVVLLAMSLATNGVLTVPAGIALALGANVGTAINPVLEGSVKSAVARRLSLGNLLSRIAGVLLILAIYPFVGPFIEKVEAAPARAVANFHLLFNIGFAILLFPFLTPFARLLEQFLPARTETGLPGAPLYLRGVPEDAPLGQMLAAATREALRLSDVLEQMLIGLREALASPDRRLIEDVRSLDDQLDSLNRAINDKLVAIDPRKVDGPSNERAGRIIAFSRNLEQAGDLIDRSLLGIVRRADKRGISFSRDGRAELVTQIDALVETLHVSTAVFLNGDIEGARTLASAKEKFRRMEEEATAMHFERLRSGNVESSESSALQLDALHDLKRVASHLIEASAYPILQQRGDLLPTRLKIAT
ncbi:Na/Pi cotransporter family protein [Novosphingobium sp. PhB165]|uniref:Na/Pi cotransporter family protein n=1 Tax=Novosphingobium sp. PhB165 TaxID=2485105 RepID=UPI001A9D7EB7|nr:Na/Pi cotransporter family protein [Novosphingobium sp. PhB165]